MGQLLCLLAVAHLFSKLNSTRKNWQSLVACRFSLDSCSLNLALHFQSTERKKKLKKTSRECSVHLRLKTLPWILIKTLQNVDQTYLLECLSEYSRNCGWLRSWFRTRFKFTVSVKWDELGPEKIQKYSTSVVTMCWKNAVQYGAVYCSILFRTLRPLAFLFRLWVILSFLPARYFCGWL